MSDYALDAVNANCLWYETAESNPGFPSLIGDRSADVVVVGGGLTGVRTALGLAESGIEVVLLEARHIAWGASGRSGGQCNPIWRVAPADLHSKFGPAAAERLVAATLTSADDLFADIARYGIRCDATQNGWVQAAHSRKSAKRLLDLQAGWSSAGAKIELLDRDQVAAKTGSPEYRLALFHGNGGHVQPLSMTVGFAKAAQTQNARIFQFTPAESIERTGRRWIVKTPKGRISTDYVVLGTNAYSDGLVPGLRESIFPLTSAMVATDPLPKPLRTRILPNGATISDTRRAIYFARTDRDCRLLFGCLGSGDNVEVLGGLRRLRAGLSRVFPNAKDVPTRYCWSGRIALTRDLLPKLVEPAPGLLAALGYGGRGIVMTSLMAKALVKRVLGASESELPFPISRMERIPLHGIMKKFMPLVAPALSALDRIDR